MKLHHDKHLATYTKNLNAALVQLAASQPEMLPSTLNMITVSDLLTNLKKIKDDKLRNAIRNNGGGYVNHVLFFSTLRPKQKDNAPSGALETALVNSFGSVENFKTQLTEKAVGQFGSGWGWLYYDLKAQKLKVGAFPNQDNPLMDSIDNVPLFGIDVWEHAYYLKYQNRRKDYVTAVFDIIDYDTVGVLLSAHAKA